MTLLGIFKRKPSPEKIATEIQAVALEGSRERRRSAMALLLENLASLPIEKKIDELAAQFNDVTREGH